MYYTREQIVSGFKSLGYRFRDFTLQTEGAYQPADAEFNYADIPHVKLIHKEFQTIPTMVEENKLATLHLQRALGFTFPVSVICYHHSRTQQTSFFTFFFYMVIVSTTFEAVGQDRTRVISDYSIGMSKWMIWIAPVVQWLLTRNYWSLMVDDIPMRERRGKLRKWGYSFLTDSRRYGYKESMDIMKDNLCTTAATLAAPIVAQVHSILPQDGSVLFGRDDHFGVKLTREGDSIWLHPRICIHEGASLDSAPCRDRVLQCPWHGRQVAPIAQFKLSESSSQVATSRYHRIELAAGQLTIQALPTQAEKHVTTPALRSTHDLAPQNLSTL